MNPEKIIFILIALLPVFATLIPLVRKSHWTIRAFDFPRLQIAILGICITFIYLLFFLETGFDLCILILIIIATAWQAFAIFPYTPFAQVQVLNSNETNSENSICLVVANVLRPNRNVDGLLQGIRKADPDIVLTLETDAWWEQELKSIEEEYKFTLKCPQDNLYGMHLYSRLPINKPEIRYLVEDRIPSMHVEVKLRSGHPVDLHCLHPAPPSPTENTASTERDAELLVVGKTVGANNRSVIVTGDLNDVAWSHTTTLFKKVSGLLDPRVGRGMFSTYNAKYWFLRWPLDHLFHSTDFTLVSIGTLPYFGSDHFPIYVTLNHEPHKKSSQEAPKAEKEDHIRAQEKIDEGGADTIDEGLR